MSKVKAHLDRFFGEGAVLEGAPSKLYFAAALAVIGNTLIAPPHATADEINHGVAVSSAAAASYEEFLADLRSKVDPSRILIFDTNNPDAGFDAASMGNEPVCMVIPAPASITVEEFFDLKGSETINTGSITALDVQKFSTLAKVGQCLSQTPSLAQGSAFATMVTSQDHSISADLIPTLIAFNEYDAWTGQARAGTTRFEAEAIRSATTMLADPSVHDDLGDWSLEEVAALSAGTVVSEENQYRSAVRGAMIRTGVSSPTGIDAQWLTDARIIPEVYHIRNLHDFLLGDPLERELPRQYAPNEIKMRVFTTVLHNQGDVTATAIGKTMGFDLDDPTAKLSKHQLEVNGLSEPDVEDTYTGPRI